VSDPLLHPVHDLSTSSPEAGTALCLSGGGYRAMLFHVGCLWRLNQLGMIGDIQRFSSVSGGSITAAVLGMNWNALAFQSGKESLRFEEFLVEPIREMARTTVDEGAILGGIFLPGTISDHVASRYDELLFHGKTLRDLPDNPRFVINATSVQTGSLMRFSKPYIGDYRVGRILNAKLPLARAVGASSAFPPVLSPCEIKLSDYDMQFEPPMPDEILSEQPYTTNLVLTDGGVYDNLGLETAWKRYDTILVSDGGGHLQAEESPHHDWARHAYRVLDLVDSQVRAMRTRQVISLFEQKARKGCYWGIRQDVRTYFSDYPLACPFETTTELAATPTRLAKLDEHRQEQLINWGYAICDASMRRFFSPTSPAPLSFPYPGSELWPSKK
jgi:NTE family protein